MISGAEGSLQDLPSVKGRLVLQQCLTARLMVQPASEEKEAQFVEIGRGVIAYVCFMKGATPALVEKMANCVLNTKLSESENGKRVSVLDLPGDLLIVPQATLGGRLKGKMMQYHGNIEKSLGLEFYKSFVSFCENSVHTNEKCKEAGTFVQYGTYGNRQVLSVNTNGPYTHIVEF